MAVAQKDDDKFIIKYNSAVICANNGQLSKAESYAREAQNIKNESDVQELLANIQKQKNKK